MMNMKSNKKGQAIVLVTLALFAMCGLIGLAVDLGWSFYLEKTSQAAADSAALAAVLEVYKIGGRTGPYTAGLTRTNANSGTVEIAGNQLSPQACPQGLAGTNTGPGANLDNFTIACLYAARNGFSNDPGNRQNVRVRWGDTSPAPEVPDVSPIHYWTTVYAAQSVPQLFSAILGNPEALVASKATAAIVDSETTGSLILLNRENDCMAISGSGQPECGINLMVQGNANCPGGCPPVPYTVRVGGGVIASSAANGVTYPQDEFAMVALGGSQVQAQYYSIRSTGGYYESNNANFGPVSPVNGGSGPMFEDPTSGVPNPPLPLPSLDIGGLVHGSLATGNVIVGSTDINNPAPVFAGVHAAMGRINGLPGLTGQPITLTGGYYKFVGPPTDINRPFNHYIFVGGLKIASGANVQLGSGQYVMLGAKPQGSNPGNVLEISSNSVVTDGFAYNQPVPSNNDGQLFVLAGPNYVSANGVTANDIIGHAAVRLGALQSTANLVGLQRGSLNIQLGNNSTALFNAHGLRPAEINPSAIRSAVNLEPYRRFLMWQDKDNSIIKYDSSGTIVPDPSCPSPCTEPLNYPLANPGVNPKSTELSIQASPGAHLYGTIYQPRGSYTTMTGGGGYSGPLQLVTGAFSVQGNATLDMGTLDYPLLTRVVALIQ